MVQSLPSDSPGKHHVRHHELISVLVSPEEGSAGFIRQRASLQHACRINPAFRAYEPSILVAQPACSAQPLRCLRSFRAASGKTTSPHCTIAPIPAPPVQFLRTSLQNFNPENRRRAKLKSNIGCLFM